MTSCEWIACSGRFPNEGEPVDVWSIEYGRLPNMALEVMSEDNKFFEPVESGPCTVRDVTHWRPIPEPPATEKVNA